LTGHLHIVSFDLPYPPGYGGVIDVFYKIRSLHEAGIRVHLHYFAYGSDKGSEEENLDELRKYCVTVNRYRRITGIRSALSLQPYIVYSRRSDELIANLLRDDYPVLFEGLHSCYYLSHPGLKGRKKIYRESNIEHDYYSHLARADHNPFRKLFFRMESYRLERYEEVLNHADILLAVSETDVTYLKTAFPGKEVVYLPSFHRDQEVASLPGKGDFVIYHGNLSVPENIAAAEHLLRSVWTAAMPKLVIAGKNPPDRLINRASKFNNVRIIANPDEEQMFSLIREAHVNLMYTFQPTGLKLKLLNALYNGRFCLVNGHMLAGTGLDDCCTVAGTPLEFRISMIRLFSNVFSEEEIGRRKAILGERFSNAINCRKIISIL
jgi:hypothetical protein